MQTGQEVTQNIRIEASISCRQNSQQLSHLIEECPGMSVCTTALRLGPLTVVLTVEGGVTCFEWAGLALTIRS